MSLFLYQAHIFNNVEAQCLHCLEIFGPKLNLRWIFLLDHLSLVSFIDSTVSGTTAQQRFGATIAPGFCAKVVSPEDLL